MKAHFAPTGMDLLSPEIIASLLRAVGVGERPALLRVTPSERTTLCKYVLYLVRRRDNEKAAGDDPETSWLVAMASSHTAMADFIMNPDRQFFTRVSWYQDFLRSITEDDSNGERVSGEQINTGAWCNLRQTCRNIRDAFDGAGLGSTDFFLSFEDWVELQLLLIHAKFRHRDREDEDAYNCHYVQNPHEYVCSGALRMLQNMLYVAVLKSIQEHPSLQVRESATQRFVGDEHARSETFMIGGIVMGSTQGCEPITQVMTTVNSNRCTNCCAVIKITSEGRPDKRKRCCSYPTCLNVSYDYE